MEYVDFLWLPLALIVTERGKRILTCLFVGASLFLLRLQVELLQQFGWGHGFLGTMESAILPRGQVTYGVFIGLFLLIARGSKGEMKHVHMAASIVILIAAFCVSSVIMVL